MTKQQKRILRIFFILYYLIWAFASVYVLQTEQSDKYMMIPVAALTNILVPVCLKVIHLKPTFEIIFVNLVFAFIASVCGTLLQFYAIPYFDKFLHFSSGILMTMLAYMIYCYLKNTTVYENKNERILALLFINAMNMMIAVFWEFFEYGCLLFLNNDAINHYTTGVHDSITDMLVAMVGGWILTYFIVKYFNTNHKNFWIRLNDNFFEKNSISSQKIHNTKI